MRLGLDTIVNETMDILYDAYLNDSAAFKSSKEYPAKEGFFELLQLQKVLFPDFFLPHARISKTHIAMELTKLADHLMSSVAAYNTEEFAEAVVSETIKALPSIRKSLKTDLIAAYAGDPAAPGVAIIIRCYPGFQVTMIYRVAHILYTSGERWYCRELMESAHSSTAIDIHPGATIGDHFFIDHGVGVVIGETAVIGEWCRIYQSVTLGAMHFQEEGGVLKRGTKRHPTVGDYVTIGAGAKLLGNITVGSYVRIGANCWINSDIDDNQTVYISEHPTHKFKPCKSGCGERKSDEQILRMMSPSPASSSSPAEAGDN